MVIVFCIAIALALALVVFAACVDPSTGHFRPIRAAVATFMHDSRNEAG
jgi:hypothetical protein